MTRYWIAVASHEHVEAGVDMGIAQFCHGKLGPAKRVKRGDWIIYYSPKKKFNQSEPCQMFTAIGMVSNDHPYQVEMFPGFKPFRRDVRYLKCKPAPVRPLLAGLNFIKDRKHWGSVFRYGFFAIDKDAFEFIATEMLDYNPLERSEV